MAISAVIPAKAGIQKVDDRRQRSEAFEFGRRKIKRMGGHKKSSSYLLLDQFILFYFV
jgi:hypothetical protein